MASVFSLSITATARTNPMYCKTQLDHLQLQKGFTSSCPQMSAQFLNRRLKLYMLPFSPFLGCSSVRSLAMDSLSEVGGRHPLRCATSGVLGPSSSEISSDLEGQLQELFDEVKRMIKSGKEDDARDLLQANYIAAKEQVDAGSRGIEEAAALDVIAMGYMALGDIKTVGSLMDVLHKIVDGLKDEELFLDSILMHMGSMHAKLEKFELSMGFYRRSLHIMEKKYGNESPFLCTPLLGMARVIGTSRRATEAIQTYKRVIKIVESSKGEEVKELVVPLLELGNLLIKHGRTSDAEYTFNRVLSIYMRSYGENDAKVAIAMRSLAQVKCMKGNVDEGVDLYKRAIHILRDSKNMALDDEVIQKMITDLAELLHAVGRGEEGQALLEECLLISENVKGKEHPSLVPHLVNLATSYSRSKNFAEAERLLRIGLQIVTKNAPPDHPSTTFPMLHLAVTLYNLHRDEEAEKLALNVLRIRVKACGKESLPVGEALDCLVSIQTRLGKEDKKLVEMLKRVLKIQEKAFGQDSEEVMETLKKIIHFLDKLGIKAEKYPLKRRLSILRNKHKQMVPY